MSRPHKRKLEIVCPLLTGGGGGEYGLEGLEFGFALDGVLGGIHKLADLFGTGLLLADGGIA